MALQCMRFTRVSASVKTAFAFFGIASQCMRFPRVSARLRRLLRSLSYGVTIYVFHTFSASVKTTSAFSVVWRYNACVLHGCLHLLRQFLSFSFYRVTMYAFHMRVCLC